jgi:formylglycine-generating enzyme required for sulfatase activity
MLASGCLFPDFDPLVCESDCGGQSALPTSTGAGPQGGDGTAAGAGGSAGGGEPGGGAPLGGGGGEPGCGPDGVLIDPPGDDALAPYCIDAFEVIWADYDPFTQSIDTMNEGTFYSLAGDECAYQPKETAVFRGSGTVFTYVFDGLTAADMQRPATAMSWCEARIYCRSLGRDLCGGVDGGVDDGPLNLSRWGAACSSFSANDYTYGDVYDESLCFTKKCSNAVDGDPPPNDYHALWEASPSSCESAGNAGLFNMTGNAAELVDNCVANDEPDGDPSDDVCRPRGGSCSILSSSTCDFVGSNTWERSDRGNYVGFRCCWEPGAG